VAARKLIRNGIVISGDTNVGDHLRADVLIEDGKIAKIAPDIQVSECEIIDATGMIVAPGFVDTHRHTWQSLGRNIAADWSLADYFHGVRGRIGGNYRPEDIYIGNLLGTLEALDSGITTLLDWSHNINSPEHADAAVQGLKDSGSRAVFAHGNANDEWVPLPNPKLHSEDARRVRSQYFSSNDGLVTMAMALRGTQFSTYDAAEQDFKLARDIDVPITIHAGDGQWAIRRRPIEVMAERNMLGPDVTYVHCNCLSDHELDLIAESGGSASIAPEVEMHMGHGYPATGRLLDHGIRPTLSIDVVTGIGGDMFGVMRCTLAAERARRHQIALDNDQEITSLDITVDDVFQFATIDGARACKLDARIGTLTPGKDADIIIVETDSSNVVPLNNPLGSLVLACYPANVDTVLVAGNVVKRFGKLCNVDMNRVRQLADDSRDHIFQGTELSPGFDWRIDSSDWGGAASDKVDESAQG
jgi:cytosine/adenosine deaminase-related metal-dependent hydrolase